MRPVQTGYFLLLGLALGFSLTIPPGPMNAFISSQAVRSLRNGIVAGSGAMSADAVLGVLVFILRSSVNLSNGVRVVYFAGASVMTLYAVLLIRSSGRPAGASPSSLRVYAQALLLGIGNPFQILWWLTAGLAFAFLGGLILFVGLFSAIAIWIVVFPAAVHRGVRSRPRLESAVIVVAAAFLLGFAAYFLYLAV
jgi:threonine/homoserine/homoserine lactone efflux protein